MSETPNYKRSTRARGRGVISFSPSEKKPGKPSLREIGIESLTENDNLEETIEKITRFVDSAERVKETAQFISDCCHNDWKFSRTASRICSRLVQLEVDGVSFRISLFQQVQMRFKEWEKADKDPSTSTFMGSKAFLCQLCANMRSAQGEVYQVLVTPVFTAIESLIRDDACDQQLTCASVQLFSVGSDLQASDPVRLQRILSIIRNDIVLAARGGKEYRLIAIDVLEAAASNWTLHKNRWIKGLNGIKIDLLLPDEDLNDVSAKITKYIDSREKLDETIQHLFQCCQQNWKFACVSSRLCCSLAPITRNGVSFREALFEQCQLKCKESNQNGMASDFCVGVMVFICQLLKTLRLSSGKPYKALVEPTFVAIEAVINNSLTEHLLKCAALQLMLVGADLQIEDLSRLSKILDVYRNLVISNKRVSKDSRLITLDLLESAASNWTLRKEDNWSQKI